MKTVSLRELPQSFQTPVQSELETGEQIVWFEQPIPRWFAGQCVGAVVFGTLWMSILLPGLSSNLKDWFYARRDVSLSFLLFMIPFLLIGVLLLTTPYWERRRLTRTIYIVTNVRALVIVLGAFGKRHVQSFGPSRLVQMERTERRDRSGDLIFEVVTTGSGSSERTERRGFKHVAEVKQVENLLRTTLLAGRVREMPAEA